MDKLQELRQELIDGLIEDGHDIEDIHSMLSWINKEVDLAVTEIKEIIDA